MSQQLKVSRDVVFYGNASHTDNVEGHYSPHEVVFYDDFEGAAIDNTYDYTVTADSGNTATIVAPHCLQLLKDTDNEGVSLATGLDWYGQYDIACEARVQITDISETLFTFGFSDNVTTHPPCSFSGTTITTGASDGVFWLYDFDGTTKNWYGISVKGDADGALIDSGHTEADGSYATLRIELYDNGTTTNAVFYLNNKGETINPEQDYVGIELDAVTRDTALCMHASLEGRDAATDTVLVDYIKIWSKRAWGTST